MGARSDEKLSRVACPKCGNTEDLQLEEASVVCWVIMQADPGEPYLGDACDVYTTEGVPSIGPVHRARPGLPACLLQ